MIKRVQQLYWQTIYTKIALYLFRCRSSKLWIFINCVWLNLTLGIWNCFWSHKNYFWRREDAYDIDYTNIHSRAHSSLNWDMLFSINISLFAMHILHGTQIHHCWHHRNSILKRRVIVEWEHLVQQFYDSLVTVTFNLFIPIL